jgi:hypothetical protein
MELKAIAKVGSDGSGMVGLADYARGCRSRAPSAKDADNDEDER